VKSGNRGIARISEEQHWKWVCEYFGISPDEVSAGEPNKSKITVSSAKSDIDSLLDF